MEMGWSDDCGINFNKFSVKPFWTDARLKVVAKSSSEKNCEQLDVTNSPPFLTSLIAARFKK
jgi:hypothetical protein